MPRIFVLLVGALAWLCTGSLPAQEAVLGQLYGSGVHAYFSGDYLKAYEKLTAAAEAGSRDPRIYYFRGLVYLNLGRAPEANLDFQKGATEEIKDVNKFYQVGRALERVQGVGRQQLEAYRIQARMVALEEANKLRKARYEAIKREEARVLKHQAEGAQSLEGEAAEAIPAPSGEESAAEPTAESFTEPATEEKAAAVEEEVGAEPASEPAAEKEVEAAEPVADKAAAQEKPAEEAKPAEDEDPFAN